MAIRDACRKVRLFFIIRAYETAKANGLNPYKYLSFIFSELPGVQFGQYPEFLEDYLPWNPHIQAVCK